MTLLLLALACSGGATVELDPTPRDLGDAECEVCGMVVAEQPAPRGQILYADGSRAFTCSSGDLRADLAAPSPHGRVVHAWVEALPVDFDPAAPAAGPLPWIPVEEAFFVVGFERPGTMGQPGLAYADEVAAKAAAQRVGGKAVRWPALAAVGFNGVP